MPAIDWPRLYLWRSHSNIRSNKSIRNRMDDILLLPSAAKFSKIAEFDFHDIPIKIELVWDLTHTSSWRIELTSEDHVLAGKSGININELPLLLEDKITIAGTPNEIKIYDAAGDKFACFINDEVVIDKALKTDWTGHALRDRIDKHLKGILPKRAKAMSNMMKWAPLIAAETNTKSPIPFSSSTKDIFAQSYSIGDDIVEIGTWKENHLSYVEGAYNLSINGKLLASRDKLIMHPGPLDGGESLVLDLSATIGGENSRLQVTECGHAFAIFVDGTMVVSYLQSHARFLDTLSNESTPQMGMGEYFLRSVLWFLPFAPVASDHFFGEEIIFFQILLAVWVVCNMPAIILKSKKSVARAQSYYPSNALSFLREQIEKNPLRFYFWLCGLATIEIFLSLNDLLDFAEIWFAFVIAHLSVAINRIPMLLKLKSVYQGQDGWPNKRLIMETSLSIGSAIIMTAFFAIALTSFA